MTPASSPSSSPAVHRSRDLSFRRTQALPPVHAEGSILENKVNGYLQLKEQSAIGTKHVVALSERVSVKKRGELGKAAKLPQTKRSRIARKKDKSLIEIGRPENFAQWESERKQLWLNIVHDPDAYYFRFCPPNVIPKTEKWSDDEIMHLKQALEERPHNGFWGLFSIHIPGRTGQQCKTMSDILQQGDINIATQDVKTSNLSPSKPIIIEEENDLTLANFSTRTTSYEGSDEINSVDFQVDIMNSPGKGTDDLEDSLDLSECIQVNSSKSLDTICSKPVEPIVVTCETPSSQSENEIRPGPPVTVQLDACITGNELPIKAPTFAKKSRKENVKSCNGAEEQPKFITSTSQLISLYNEHCSEFSNRLNCQFQHLLDVHRRRISDPNSILKSTSLVREFRRRLRDLKFSQKIESETFRICWISDKPEMLRKSAASMKLKSPSLPKYDEILLSNGISI